MNEWIVLGIGAACLASCVGIYNGLVTARNRFKNGFAQIDVQLKRRYDLIPGLLETARAYLTHESETLENVVNARNGAMAAAKAAGLNPGDPESMKALGSAEALLGGALGKLSVVMEAYPDLKGNETMEQFMEELTSTENRIAFSRQEFNDHIMRYNIAREKFPNTIVASMFNFVRADQLQIEFAEGGRDAPQISF
jgi:LemA protein